MHIPTYWAQARLRQQSRPSHGVTVQRWGWSDLSQEAAQAHAHERARLALEAALAAGRQSPAEPRMEWKNEYGLDGATPIREQVIERRGSTVMTRNSYGARCLNTERVVIADLDLPEPQRPAPFPALTLLLLALAVAWLVLQAPHATVSLVLSLVAIALLLAHGTRRLRRWMQARQARQARAPGQDDSPQGQLMQRVQDFHRSHPGWGLRVYRTPNGLRVIVTHLDYACDDPAVQELFDALQVDPLYAMLCSRQRCFRARVSAKPWRMGLASLPTSLRRWPQDPASQAPRQQWILDYDERARRYSACRLLQQLGSTLLSTEVQAFVQWHDEASQALSELPLA